MEIFVFGKTGVGKSSLIRRFMGERYDPNAACNVRDITIGKNLANYLLIFFISSLSTLLFVIALYCFHAEHCYKLSSRLELIEKS